MEIRVSNINPTNIFIFPSDTKNPWLMFWVEYKLVCCTRRFHASLFQNLSTILTAPATFHSKSIGVIMIKDYSNLHPHFPIPPHHCPNIAVLVYLQQLLASIEFYRHPILLHLSGYQHSKEYLQCPHCLFFLKSNFIK